MTEATKRENEVPGATIREAGSPFGTIRETGTTASGTASRSLLRLPAALAEQYEIERELHTRGNEADVLVARDRWNGQSVAIKLYRPNIAPKHEVLNLLATLDTNYVIRQLANGNSEGRTYEVMELATGSLADLLADRKVKLSAIGLCSVVKQVAAALNYLHTLKSQIVHRDIKPDNILIRHRTPLKLVLTDFGISSVVEHGSRVASSVNRTTLYAAPEAGAGDVSAVLDWWSLGMIIAEAAAGRHPFEGILEQSVNIHYARREPIPLDGITDPRLKLLCQGLLCYDQKKRWGMAEVQRWLDGDTTLASPVEDTHTQPIEGHRAARPYRISGTDCWTLTELASALAANWDEAVKRVGRRDVEPWLRDDLRDHDAFNHFLDLNDGQAFRSLDPVTKLSLWLPMLDPSLPPMVDGQKLTEERFLALAHAVAKGSSPWPTVLQPGYGEQLAELANAQWLSKIYTEWRAASAEAKTLDDKLRASTPSLTQISTGGQVSLLLLVIDPATCATASKRLTASASSAEVRACRWAAPLIPVNKLTPAGLWILGNRLPEIQAAGAAERKNIVDRKRKIRTVVVYALVIIGISGGIWLNNLNDKINIKNKAEFLQKAKESWQTGYDSGFLTSASSKYNKSNITALHPMFFMGAASQISNGTLNCGVGQVTMLEITEARCAWGSIGKGGASLSFWSNMMPDSPSGFPAPQYANGNGKLVIMLINNMPTQHDVYLFDRIIGTLTKGDASIIKRSEFIWVPGNEILGFKSCSVSYREQSGNSKQIIFRIDCYQKQQNENS